MQISVESNSDIKKTLTIVVPQQEVDTAVNKRYDEVKRNARIDGFRPGKVPMSVIKKKFGTSVKAEALSELTQSFLYKAIMEEKLNPASVPVITPNDDAKDGYEFSASFEVYPEITINAVEDLKLKTPVVEIADSDIDGVIEKLRSQKKTWNEVKAEAKKDNRVTISFEGKVNEKAISKEPIKSFPVVIGSKSMIPGFEDKLVGVKAGETLSFEVTFPEDYQQADFAGEVGQFDVEVEKVEKSELPEVNEEFIKLFGVESGEMTGFRDDLKNNMRDELKRALGAKRKTIVMDAIIENNDVSVPAALVDNEISQMISSLNEKAAQAGQPAQSDLAKELFEEQATKRVKLGLLLNEMIKQNDIKADDAKVQERIEELARTYESPEGVVNWYNSNPAERSKVESAVLEDQLVNWVLERASITETSLTFEELMAPAQQ
ncbi:MAG: trigger factor [Cycloclasticus sp. symbiont of Poecilosclerida sp. N]|nr:MAG: trigger factor [Cycloclasticus sp. symbiont of Poecilosclerida sp. N]